MFHPDSHIYSIICRTDGCVGMTLNRHAYQNHMFKEMIHMEYVYICHEQEEKTDANAFCCFNEDIDKQIQNSFKNSVQKNRKKQNKTKQKSTLESKNFKPQTMSRTNLKTI